MAVATYFSSKLYLSNLQRVCKLSVFRASIKLTASIFIPAQCHSPHVCQIRRFPKKSCYKFFFATNLLCNALNLFIWIYNTPYFSTYLHQLQQPCASEKQGQLPHSCTTSSFFHSFDNFVITPKPFLMAGIF